MRSQRASIPVRIHFLIVELVVAHGICTEFRIVALGGQNEGGTAAPAAHELRREQFLIIRRVGVLVQIVAEQSNVLLQSPVGHVASIAAQYFWLRQIGRPVLVGIAEDELPGFSGAPDPGVGTSPEPSITGCDNLSRNPK